MATNRRNRNNGEKKKKGVLTYLKWAGLIGAGAVVGHIATKAYKERFEQPAQAAQGGLQNPLMAAAFNPFDTRNAPQINVFAQGPIQQPEPPPPPAPPPPAPPPDLRPSLTTDDDGEDLL